MGEKGKGHENEKRKNCVQKKTEGAKSDQKKCINLGYQKKKKKKKRKSYPVEGSFYVWNKGKQQPL